jgi:O-antigen/teichoic acid export membrane protein
MKVWVLLRKADFLAASGCTVLGALVSFAYSLYVKKFVMPYEFGVYTTAALALTYMGYLQLGILNSFNRDYPRILGSGDQAAAERLRRNVFTCLTVIYAAAAVLGAAGALLLVRLRVMSSLFNFFENSVRSEGRVIYASLTGLTRSVLLAAVGFVAVPAWGYWGLYAALLVSAAGPFLFFAGQIRTLRFLFEKSLLWVLLKTGAPLLVNALIWTVMLSVDKFIILATMSMAELGVYSTAMLGFSTLVLVPASISQVFYIALSRKYGETDSREVLLCDADRFTYRVSLFTGAVCFLAYFLLPLIIGAYIPAYAGGIRSAQILIAGVSLYSTTMIYSNVLTILKLNKKLLLNTVLLVLFNAVLSTVFVLLWGRLIENVALGTALSFSLYSVLLIFMLGRTVRRPPAGMLLGSWLPVLCVLIPCMVVSELIPSGVLSFLFAAAIAGLLLGILHLIRKKRRESPHDTK